MRKPTASEVEEFALYERDFPLNGQTFIDFYDSKGWMIGKSPMKSWKGAVGTFKQRWTEKTTAKQRNEQLKAALLKRTKKEEPQKTAQQIIDEIEAERLT